MNQQYVETVRLLLAESPRLSRRLHFLRGWSNGKYVEEISG